MKKCRYVNCNQEVPDSRKSYHTMDCYYKQQSIDAAERRERLRRMKKGTLIICANKNCSTEFTRTGAKKFCSADCRKEAKGIKVPEKAPEPKPIPQ